MSNEYTPDSWVVIRMTNKDEVIYKVLAGWSGSYLYGDSWRLNSGITEARYDVASDVWKFIGSSGSVYRCNPEQYGLKVATYPVWQQMLKKYPTQVEMLDNRNWEEMDWTK